MLRDRLLDLYYDIRDFAGRNRKLVMPVVLFLCVLITVGAAFGLRRSARQKSSDTVQVDLSADEVELELNAYPEVNELIAQYYQAVADGDAETIASLCLTITEEEQIRIQELGSYIDSYTDIDVYTKTGPIDNSYIAYVYSHLKLVDHTWEIPGMQTLYVCTGDSGSLYINNSETQSEEITEYISLASLQDDVVDLNNQIAAEYNDMLTNDEDLSEYLDQMASVIDISVGQQLAALATSQTQDSESSVYVEITADDINIRKSPSTDGTKIGTAQSGDQYQLVEQLEDGWTEILYNGQTAYVKSDYVTIMDSQSE